MSKGVIQVYYGNGRGKTTAAVGDAIRAASEGKSAMVIQFLKRKNEQQLAFLNRLEPEIKFFRFAKSNQSFEELSENEKQEEVRNLRNGFNYGKKVVTTGACDVLILDELLGILDEKVVTEDEVRELLAGRPEDMTLICTGRVLNGAIRECADEIYHIALEK